MEENLPQVVITRNPAFVEYLREIGLISRDARVIPDAEPNDVRRRHVIAVGGAVPMHLAARASLLTEIPLVLAPEDRVEELTLERLRQVAQLPRTYNVWELRTWKINEFEIVRDWE